MSHIPKVCIVPGAFSGWRRPACSDALLPVTPSRPVPVLLRPVWSRPFPSHPFGLFPSFCSVTPSCYPDPTSRPIVPSSSPVPSFHPVIPSCHPVSSPHPIMPSISYHPVMPFRHDIIRSAVFFGRTPAGTSPSPTLFGKDTHARRAGHSSSRPRLPMGKPGRGRRRRSWPWQGRSWPGRRLRRARPWPRKSRSGRHALTRRPRRPTRRRVAGWFRVLVGVCGEVRRDSGPPGGEFRPTIIVPENRKQNRLSLCGVETHTRLWLLSFFSTEAGKTCFSHISLHRFRDYSPHRTRLATLLGERMLH